MGVINLAEHQGSGKNNSLPMSTSEIIHLPVAPQVTARTRFASSVPRRLHFMMPHDAVAMLRTSIEEQGENVSMVAITGPGDPLAVPDTTIQTIELVKKSYPDMQIGLKTRGFGGDKFAGDLARAGVTYIELLVDAVKAPILEKLYAWIRPGLKTLKISDAVELLMREQRNAVPAFKYENMGVSIVTTLYPGYNIDHVKKISEVMMELGADSISLVPYVAELQAEVVLQEPGCQVVEKAYRAVSRYLPVVQPLLSAPVENKNESIAVNQLPRPTLDRKNVAVVSSNGIEVDLHLGHAVKILIYGPREDGLPCLLEMRDAPEPGSGPKRWKELADLLSDCFIILAASAGKTPKTILSENGISVLITEETIEGCVDVLFGGGKKQKKRIS